MAYNDTLIENTPFTVTNSLCQIVSKSYNETWSINFGFSQAIPWNFRELFTTKGTYVGGCSGVTFTNMENDNTLEASSDREYYFPVAGDYSPQILITFYNGSKIVYKYEQIKVHVISEIEASSEQTNKSNLGLTYALFGFAVVDLVLLIYKLLDKDSKSKTTCNPITYENSPEKNTISKKVPDAEDQNDKVLSEKVTNKINDNNKSDEPTTATKNE